MLYLGYTGFTVPFAFALGALLGRYPGEKWIHITRRWTMIASVSYTHLDVYKRQELQHLERAWGAIREEADALLAARA